jgi:hypothetical protein
VYQKIVYRKSNKWYNIYCQSGSFLCWHVQFIFYGFVVCCFLRI